MKISEFIEKLKELEENAGDLELFVAGHPGEGGTGVEDGEVIIQALPFEPHRVLLWF
jgi:hypothetical protein